MLGVGLQYHDLEKNNMINLKTLKWFYVYQSLTFIFSYTIVLVFVKTKLGISDPDPRLSLWVVSL